MFHTACAALIKQIPTAHTSSEHSIVLHFKQKHLKYAYKNSSFFNHCSRFILPSHWTFRLIFEHLCYLLRMMHLSILPVICQGHTVTPAHSQPLSIHFTQGQPLYLYSSNLYSEQTSNLRAASSTVSSLCTRPLPPGSPLTFDCAHVIVRFVFWLWNRSFQLNTIHLQMWARFSGGGGEQVSDVSDVIFFMILVVCCCCSLFDV